MSGSRSVLGPKMRSRRRRRAGSGSAAMVRIGSRRLSRASHGESAAARADTCRAERRGHVRTPDGAELTARGIVTPSGARWHAQTVIRMMNRAKHALSDRLSGDYPILPFTPDRVLVLESLKT